MKKLPKYVHGYNDRLGKARYYYKRPGCKPVPLRGLPWSPEFMAAYDLAHGAYAAPDVIPLGASRTRAGTLNAALVRYYESATFLQGLATSTQGPQRSLLERWRKGHGDLPLRPLQQKHIQGFISKLGSPSVQRNMLRAIRHFTKFAKGAALIDDDPALSVSRAKMIKTGGFFTWTEEHVAKFEERHPVGSKARLALALYLNLGVRKSDVVRVGPRYIRDGVLHNFLPRKGERTDGKRISVKLFEETKAIIAATPVIGTETYLVTSFGKPFTANGFGNKIREWCDEAGLPDCTSHGLRKLMMIRLVHEGYSAPAIGAISGHKDLREIQLYIDEYNREQMAIETMTDFEQRRVEKVQKANKTC
jgi:integrase